jgi:hypothetical protein
MKIGTAAACGEGATAVTVRDFVLMAAPCWRAFARASHHSLTASSGEPPLSRPVIPSEESSPRCLRDSQHLLEWHPKQVVLEQLRKQPELPQFPPRLERSRPTRAGRIVTGARATGGLREVLFT